MLGRQDSFLLRTASHTLSSFKNTHSDHDHIYTQSILARHESKSRSPHKALRITRSPGTKALRAWARSALGTNPCFVLNAFAHEKLLEHGKHQ